MSQPNNVTKFPGPRRPAAPKGPDLRWPALAVYGLGVAAFALFLSGRQFADLAGLAFGIAAVVIAAGRRDEGPAWVRSHHEFGLRTVVIAGAIWTLLSLLTFLPMLILPSYIARLVLGGWLLIRSVYGAGQVLRRKIISNPRTPFL